MSSRASKLLIQYKNNIVKSRNENFFIDDTKKYLLNDNFFDISTDAKKCINSISA
jgi:hypothetical protein